MHACGTRLASNSMQLLQQRLQKMHPRAFGSQVLCKVGSCPALSGSTKRGRLTKEWAAVLLSVVLYHTLPAGDLSAAGRGVDRENIFYVTVHADRPVNTINPTEALAAGVDGHEQGEAARMFTDKNNAAEPPARVGRGPYRHGTDPEGDGTHWHAH